MCLTRRRVGPGQPYLPSGKVWAQQRVMTCECSWTRSSGAIFVLTSCSVTLIGVSDATAVAGGAEARADVRSHGAVLDQHVRAVGAIARVGAFGLGRKQRAGRRRRRQQGDRTGGAELFEQAAALCSTHTVSASEAWSLLAVVADGLDELSRAIVAGTEVADIHAADRCTRVHAAPHYASAVQEMRGESMSGTPAPRPGRSDDRQAARRTGTSRIGIPIDRTGGGVSIRCELLPVRASNLSI